MPLLALAAAQTVCHALLRSKISRRTPKGGARGAGGAVVTLRANLTSTEGDGRAIKWAGGWAGGKADGHIYQYPHLTTIR